MAVKFICSMGRAMILKCICVCVLLACLISCWDLRQSMSIQLSKCVKSLGLFISHFLNNVDFWKTTVWLHIMQVHISIYAVCMFTSIVEFLSNESRYAAHQISYCQCCRVLVRFHCILFSVENASILAQYMCTFVTTVWYYLTGQEKYVYRSV